MEALFLVAMGAACLFTFVAFACAVGAPHRLCTGSPCKLAQLQPVP